MTTSTPIPAPTSGSGYTWDALGYSSHPYTQAIKETLFDVPEVDEDTLEQLQNDYHTLPLERALALDYHVMEELSELMGFCYRRLPASGTYDDTIFEEGAKRIGVDPFDLRWVVDGVSGMDFSNALLDLIAADMCVDPTLLRAWQIHATSQQCLTSEGDLDARYNLTYVWTPELGGDHQLELYALAKEKIEEGLKRVAETVFPPTPEQMAELIHYHAPVPKVLKLICEEEMLPFSYAAQYWYDVGLEAGVIELDTLTE